MKNNIKKSIVINPALFVVDTQNCFMAPEGSYDRMGFDISKYRLITKNLIRVIEKARKLSMPIFFSKAIREASGIDNLDRVHKILPLKRRERIETIPLCIRGTWDSEIIDELKVDPKKDHILEKRRDSAFRGTELEVWLKALKINTLIFAGIDTAVCVESSLRDAFNIGYDVILLSDATASMGSEMKKTTLEEVKSNFGIVMDSEII